MLFRRHVGMLLLLWLGCSSVVSQSLFLRELLNIFSGNEFSLGIMLAVWLLSSALGATWGDRLSRSGSAAGFTLAGMNLLALLLPLTPIAIQAYRSMSGLPPEVILPPAQVVLASLLLLTIPAFLHGLLFPLACALLGDPAGNSQSSAGQGYAVESLGCLTGGLLAAFVLIPLVRPVPALVGVSLAGLAASLLLACSVRVGKRGRKAEPAMVLLVAVGLLAASMTGRFALLEQRVVSAAYPYARVLYSGSTRYQKLTLLSMGGQHTLMGGGMPLLTLPYPDDGSAEATALIPIMAVAKPSSVLIMGGLDSLPRQVTAVSAIQRIDFLEADPGLFDALSLIPDARRRLGLEDPRSRMIREDGRTWLARTGEHYDVVLVSLPPPASLAANRFYSAEFFRLVARLLAKEGIVAVVLPGSETYLTPSMSGLLATVTSAMEEALPFTLAIPGDRTLLLASSCPLAERLRPALLSSRLPLHGIHPRIMTPAYLDDRLAPERISWLKGEMARSAAPINRDSAPSGTLYSLTCQMEQQGSATDWWRRLFSRQLIPPLVGLLLAATVLPAFFSRKGRQGLWLGVLASTGFTAMALEILLMLAYQSHTGLIYQGVALFTSAFMAGSALGVCLARQWERHVGPQRVVLFSEAMFLLLTGVLALRFFSKLSAPIATTMFLGCLLAGLLAGQEFQAVTRILGGRVEGRERAGAAYAADLLGACMGGLLAGLALIPLAGFGATCVILAAIKALQIVVLIGTSGHNGRLP